MNRTNYTREGPVPLPNRTARLPGTCWVYPQVRLVNVQPGDGAADQHPLDLAGALEDREDLGWTAEPLASFAPMLTCANTETKGF